MPENDPEVKHFSLTGRIITVVVICQLLLTAGLTLTAVFYARKALLGAFDAALDGHATSALACVRYNEVNLPDVLFDPSLLPYSPEGSPDLFEIQKADGELVARSMRGIPSMAAMNGNGYANFTFSSVPYRAVVLRDVAILDNEDEVQVPARVTVVYASSLALMHRQLVELAGYVAGTSLLLLLIASQVAAWGVRRGLEPLRELALQAGAISVHNWNFRPPAGAKMAGELAPLTGAIETVLGRLKDAFRQQRDFTSDAAHELKTSVAIVKSTLQSLAQWPRPQEEYRAALEGLLQDCARLEDLLERMLRLARIEQWSENGTPRNLGTTELTSTCEAAISRIQALASARDIAIELVHSTTLDLRADPEDLELIWVNLLENAVRYSPPGSKVSVRVEPNGGARAYIYVEDSGPGIPPEELPYIFERFRRGDPSRSRATGGFGLGLAICKAMVVAYGGQIEAVNRTGRGTQVRVELPVETY